MMHRHVKRERPVLAVELSSRVHADGNDLSTESALEFLKRDNLLLDENTSFVEGRKFFIGATSEEQQHDLAVFSMVRISCEHLP